MNRVLSRERPPLRCLDDTDARPPKPRHRTPDVRGEPATADLEPESVVRCRCCDQHVTSRRHAFSFRANGSIQVFPNPWGQMKKIWTVRSAHDLVIVGPPTVEFTWFDGFAWAVALCARCRNHLGWRYDAVQAGRPPAFYGLLMEALRDG